MLFRSQALLQDYFEYRLVAMEALLGAVGPSGRERLIGYWQQWLDSQCDECTEQKCLVVKLAAEVADLSDAMRLTLRDGTDRVIARIARVIDDGIADDSLPALDALPVAQTLYQLWLGASLIGKLHRNRKSLENAMDFTMKLLSP